MKIERETPKSEEVFLDHLTHKVDDINLTKLHLKKYGFTASIERNSENKKETRTARAMFQQGFIEFTDSSDYFVNKNKNAAINAIALETSNLEGTQGRLTLNGFHPLPLYTEMFSIRSKSDKQIEFKTNKCRLKASDMAEAHAEFIFHDTEKTTWKSAVLDHNNCINALRDAIFCVDNPDEVIARYCWFSNKGSPQKLGNLGWRLTLDRGSLIIYDNDGFTDLLDKENLPQGHGIMGYSLLSEDISRTIEFFKKKNCPFMKVSKNYISLKFPDPIGGIIFIAEDEGAFPWFTNN